MVKKSLLYKISSNMNKKTLLAKSWWSRWTRLWLADPEVKRKINSTCWVWEKILIGWEFSIDSHVKNRNHFVFNEEVAKKLLWPDYAEWKNYYVRMPQLNAEEIWKIRKIANNVGKVRMRVVLSESEWKIRIIIWEKLTYAWDVSIESKTKKNKK